MKKSVLILLILIIFTNIVYAACVKCPDYNSNGVIDEQDKSLFVNCAYYDINCSLFDFDLNGDGFVSIVGDVPCMPNGTNISSKSINACKGNCIPNCTGKECGSNGCNGSCGNCITGKVCSNGACISNCTEIWNCTKWAPCIAGTQLRVCTDINHCGTQIYIPAITSACQIINNITYQINQTLNNTLNQASITSNNSGVRVVIKNVSFIGGVEIKIERKNEVIKLMISNSDINSTLDLREKDKKVYAVTTNGEKEIKLLPWDAINTAKRIKDVESVEIEEYKGKPVYSISGTKKARLFFVIPLTAEVNQKINLEDGKLIHTKRPWWHVLSLGV